MAEFLTGNALNLELEKIFMDANEQLILISPYIKLHPRFISALKTKLDNHKLEIVVVFGKNEVKSRSMSEQDFEFLQTLPNIQIYFEQHLHAKYYANESRAILTSMNLYDYSLNNNIEAGVLTKTSLLQHMANNLVSNVTGDDHLDREAQEYFDKVIEQAELLFDKQPQYESALLGLSKKYVKSIVQEDKLSEFFSNEKKFIVTKIKGSAVTGVNHIGYCIRTGKKIPFNRDYPFCDEAFQSWDKFKNKDYPEKYCHFTGEASNGLTSFGRPILRKNWRKAKQVQNH
jgi:hypothetical protein